MPVWFLRAKLEAPIWARWRDIRDDETDANTCAAVLADTEAEARLTVGLHGGGEEPVEAWTDPANADALALSLCGPPRILLTSLGTVGGNLFDTAEKK